MTERPKKKNVLHGHDTCPKCRDKIGWNDCIDAWEAWLKEQPKDAVSVPTVDEIMDILEPTWRGYQPYKSLEISRELDKKKAKAIHALITRKLKGQDNDI